MHPPTKLRFFDRDNRCPHCGGYAWAGQSAEDCGGGIDVMDAKRLYCSSLPEELSWPSRSGRTRWTYLTEPYVFTGPPPPRPDREHHSSGPSIASRGFKLQKIHPYHDANGNVVFEVLRYRNRQTGDKEIRQRKGPGDWSIAGVELVLYRLPRVLRAARAGGRIYLAEGESDVEAIERHAGDAVATTAPMGAAQAWRDSYTGALRGAREVVVVADDDVPGRARAKRVVVALTAAGIPARAVLPAIEGGDLRNHLEAGHKLGDLRPLEDES